MFGRPALAACLGVPALVGLALLVPGSARACSCIAPTGDLLPILEEARSSADAVFFGRVASITPGIRVGGLHLRYARANFYVLQAFKGVSGNDGVVLLDEDGSDCARRFEVGAKYLVYATRRASALEARICSRTREIGEEDPEIVWLSAGKIPPVPVALEREDVECRRCDLFDAPALLTGAVEGSETRGDGPPPHGLVQGDAPVWYGGFRGDGGTVSVGVSADHRLFELFVSDARPDGEPCHRSASVRWCERLERVGPWKSGRDAPAPLRCVNPTSPQPVCNEDDSRTVRLRPPELLRDGSCCWPTSTEARCTLSQEEKALAPDAGTYPLLLCHAPIENADGPDCRVVLAPRKK